MPEQEQQTQEQRKEKCIWKAVAEENRRGEGNTFDPNDRSILCYKCDGLNCLYKDNRYAPQAQ